MVLYVGHLISSFLEEVQLKSDLSPTHHYNVRYNTCLVPEICNKKGLELVGDLIITL